MNETYFIGNRKLVTIPKTSRFARVGSGEEDGEYKFLAWDGE